ncbi:MAG: phosphoribosylformylglycinamidine synthase subunit PurQ [Bdellovibrio sp.]|nr:MAG: phosphoribosylformylglycinamidine synthase subunit PurQ [Bdellovibrio sp.]
MKPVGVIRFLGTNCDRDIWQALQDCGLKPKWVWFQDQFHWKDYAAFILPGGFSYGDYLRCGALASKAPVMKSLTEAACHGVPVLGICNGFQILCEAGLLPGVLVQNQGLRFIDSWEPIRCVSSNPYWGGVPQEVIQLPIAHGEGRYYLDEGEVKKLFDEEQVWWTYEENPNGSLEDIAGVMNELKNVAGLMPHPERAVFPWMGDESGRSFFQSLLKMIL